jgi:hypothetical protein
MTLIELQAVLKMPLIGPQRIEMGHLRIRERVVTPEMLSYMLRVLQRRPLFKAIDAASISRSSWRAVRTSTPLSYAAMEKLILKRASVNRPSGEWNDDDYDVLNDGKVVGRIMKAAASPVGAPWMWTLAYGYHEGRSPTHGYEADRFSVKRYVIVTFLPST